jgi:hypothetical protein
VQTTLDPTQLDQFKGTVKGTVKVAEKKAPEKTEDKTRLSGYGKLDRNATAARLDDIAGQEVTVTGFRVAPGKYGDFAFLDVVLATGESLLVMSGGMFVLDALIDAKNADAFPLQVSFHKKGKAWMFE